jgi:hypothetical protein
MMADDRVLTRLGFRLLRERPDDLDLTFLRFYENRDELRRTSTSVVLRILLDVVEEVMAREPFASAWAGLPDSDKARLIGRCGDLLEYRIEEAFGDRWRVDNLQQCVSDLVREVERLKAGLQASRET